MTALSCVRACACDVRGENGDTGAPVGGWALLPGDLVDAEAQTLRGRVLLAHAGDDPAMVGIRFLDVYHNGDPHAALTALVRAADAHLQAGDDDAARDLYRRARLWASLPSRPDYEAAARFGLALVCAVRGDRWGALAIVDDIRAGFSDTAVWGMLEARLNSWLNSQVW